MGYHVFATCLKPDSDDAQSLLKKCKHKETMDVIKVDVTSKEDLINASAHVTRTLNERNLKLHAVVNNAGIMLANSTTLETEPTADDFDLQMNVNFYGVVRTTRAFLPTLAADKGRLVNLTSLAGRFSPMYSSAYCASKHAAVSFTHSLRSEAKQLGVTAISVEPWFYRTGLISMEVTTSLLRKQWLTASDATKGRHGSDFMRLAMKTAKMFFTHPYAVDPDVNEVVDALVDAVTSIEPQMVYRVSRLEKIVPLKLLLEFTPFEFNEWVSDTIIALCAKYGEDIQLDDNYNFVK